MTRYGFSGQIRGLALLGAGLLVVTITEAASAERVNHPAASSAEQDEQDNALLASPWRQVQSSQLRLIAGRQNADGGFVAGLEIVLPDGWKTYWRNPGDAGGVPPELDWSGSENVADTTLIYPAPQRFKDSTGETIGYEGRVVMPVLVKPLDPARGMVLQVRFHYGLCGEICIPVDETLTLDVPRDVAPGLPAELSEALRTTPRSGKDIQPGDPKLVRHEVMLDGDQPRIVLDVDFGREPDTGDLFAEASDGIYLPMAQPKGTETQATRRFEIDLLAANDPAELKGKTLRVTMVGASGQSEASFVIE